MKYFWLSILFISLLTLSACGYRFGGGELSSRYRTIAVPYAEGDFDGSFTTEMIKQIATSGTFLYTREAPDLILRIRLIDFDHENIGFRYYRNKKDELTRDTIPVETRLFLTAEVSLIDSLTGCPIQTPVRIVATTDFDHDYYSTRDDINVFSLGQLTDYDEALDAAEKPLHYNLAKKVVDFISDSW